MKIQEIISEEHNRGDLQSVLTARGYKLLGSGHFATVWQASNGSILKVFSASEYKNHDGTWIVDDNDSYSEDLQEFLMFYNYVKQHPSPYLPRFGKLKRVKFDNREYVIVSTEPLMKRSTNPETEDVFRNLITNGGDDSWEAIINYYGNGRFGEVLRKYGPKTFMPVAKLAFHLSRMSDAWDFPDPATNNIMFRGDVPVINDPW